MALSPEEREAMTAVLTAAITYADCIEHAIRLIEQGNGDLSDRQRDEIIEHDAQAGHALVAAVRRYRALNEKRSHVGSI